MGMAVVEDIWTKLILSYWGRKKITFCGNFQIQFVDRKLFYFDLNLIFVPKGPIDSKLTLVHVMAV